MPRINLLPWREQQRKERKLAFFVSLGGAAIGALLVAFAGYLMVNSMISAQERRNERLRTEIKAVDRQIEQINDLESQKQRFISRMQVIEKLQRSRSEVVHLFDEVAKTIPDGTYLTTFKQDGQAIEVRRRRPVLDPRVHLHAQHLGSLAVDEGSGARVVESKPAIPSATVSYSTPARW